MSNVQHLTAMTRQQRLSVIIEAFKDDQDLLERAHAGVSRLNMKELSRHQRQALPHVVHRHRISEVSGKPVVVHEYLTAQFVRGTMVRRWGDAYNAFHFDTAKDAERARAYNEEGSVILVSCMPIEVDALGQNARGLGIGL